MDMISAVKKCEEMVKNTLIKDKRRYDALLLKLNKADINVESLENKCERLEKENKILIDMVWEERQNVQLLKEEIRRSQDMVEQERDISRIRFDIEAKICDETVSSINNIISGETITTPTISSALGNEEECNDDTLTEKIDEDEQKDINRLIEDDSNEQLNIDQAEALDEGQNVGLDESIHIISDYRSVDQNILVDHEKCDECNEFFESAQEIRIHIEKSHTMAQISEEQKEVYSEDIAAISVNVSDSLYDKI